MDMSLPTSRESAHSRKEEAAYRIWGNDEAVRAMDTIWFGSGGQNESECGVWQMPAETWRVQVECEMLTANLADREDLHDVSDRKIVHELSGWGKGVSWRQTPGES